MLGGNRCVFMIAPRSCSLFFFLEAGGGGVWGEGNEYLDLQIRVKNWQLFPNQNICCGYSMNHLKAYLYPLYTNGFFLLG